MKVLVTRESRQAAETARNLAEAGHEGVLLPLVEYRDVNAIGQLPGPDGLEAVLFTSEAGVDAFCRFVARDPSHAAFFRLPAFCVGDKTRMAAANAGFGDARSAAGDAQALADVVSASLGTRLAANSRRILYPAARHKSRDMAVLLPDFEIREVTVYEALLCDPGPAQLGEALDRIAGGAVFLYSSRTASHFLSLVGKYCMTGRLKVTIAIAISPVVAETVRNLSVGVPEFTIRVANSPDEKEMIRCLAGAAGP